MPACPNGASLAAGAPDQVWLDKLLLLSDISGEIIRVAPWAWAQYAAELHDTASICAKNPDPPAPLTAEDIIKGTAQFPFGGLYGPNPVLQYLADYALYAAFLRNCVCNGPAPPGPGMCPWTAFTTTLGQGASSPAVAYDVPQATYDQWPVTGTPPNQDWKPVRQGSMTSMSPSGSSGLQWEWLDGSTWRPVELIRNFETVPVACSATTLFLQPPRMPRTGQVRIRNVSAAATTLTGFNFCFCGLSATPPPNNPPATGPTPVAPAPTGCTTDDICTAINELNRRLNFLSAEISDLLAAGGAQTLRTLATQTISGEGRATLVVGTRAVHVGLSAIPARVGKRTMANPDELFDVGSLRWYDGLGYTRRELIDSASFSSTRTPGALEVTWALREGVTAELAQLG